MANDKFNRPAGLSESGNTAYDIIMKFLEERKLTKDGDMWHNVFWNPKESAFQYGKNGELIVLYEEGTFRHVFSMDAAYELGGMMNDLRSEFPDMQYKAVNCYSALEALQERLHAAGLFFEEATTYYGTIYKR